MAGKDRYVTNLPNPGALNLKAIHQQLTEGVQPESGYESMTKLIEISDGLRDDLHELGQLVGQLGDIWQAPSTQRGVKAITDVQDHVQQLGAHAGQLGAAFNNYLEDVDTARHQVPEPKPTDDLGPVTGLTGIAAGALIYGPLLVAVYEGDEQLRTEEARQVMQQLTHAAQVADAATPGFEPLPTQSIDTAPHEPTSPSGPTNPSGPNRRVLPIPAAPGPDTTTGSPPPAPLQTGPPPTPLPEPPPALTALPAPPAPNVAVTPIQITTQQSTTGVITNLTSNVSVSADVPRGLPGPNVGVDVSIPGAPGGRSTAAPPPEGRAGGGPGGGRGASPAPGAGGSPAPGAGGLPASEHGRAGRGVAGRGAAGMPGMPLGAGGRSPSDEDYEHQRAPYLQADDDPDELFGTNQKTAPPVIGAPNYQQP